MTLTFYATPEEVHAVLHCLQETLWKDTVCTAYIRRSSESCHWCVTSFLEFDEPQDMSLVQEMFELGRGEDRTDWSFEVSDGAPFESWRASKISMLDDAGLLFLAIGSQAMKMMFLQGDVEGFFECNCIDVLPY